MIYKSFQVFCKCFRCMLQVFQLFQTYVASVSSGCFKSRSRCYRYCNVTYPATTTCCSCLGTVHARGERRDGALLGIGRMKAEGDGSRGAGGPRATCGCSKRRGRGHPNRGAKWGHNFLGAVDTDVRRRNRLQPRTFGRRCPSGRPGASCAVYKNRRVVDTRTETIFTSDLLAPEHLT
jgi:hypothetical protein